jgi:hypothetical protein
MLIKILGTIDFFASMIFLFTIINISFPNSIYILFGIILLVKSSLGMLQDFASWIDFLGGLFFLFSLIINIPKFMFLAMGILIIQKAFFSFFKN